jgi:hypothetical protein
VELLLVCDKFLFEADLLQVAAQRTCIWLLSAVEIISSYFPVWADINIMGA